MKEKKNIILILIVIFLIIVISLIVTLHTLNKNQKFNSLEDRNILGTTNNTDSTDNTSYPINTDTKYDETLSNNATIDKKLKYEDVPTDYFTIKALTENYINLIGNKDKARAMNILSKDYISKYNINSDNIFDNLVISKLTNYNQSYKVNISQILSAQVDDNIYVYIVKANCRIVGTDELFSVQVMFEVDTINKVYNTYPTQYIKDNGYNNLSSGNIINYKAEAIIQNENNKFTNIIKSEEEIAKEHFNDYNELLLYYPDEAYNKLNPEYSKKRFGSKDSFREYVKENARILYLMQIDKYKVVSRNNYIDYVCSDKYNNIYIFRQEKGIMRYTVFLDNYTIMTEDDNKYYNSLDKFDKSKYNLTKFINMVNTKDYNAIYNILDATFRSNNFKNIDTLKQYIKNNLYEINSLEIEDYDDETYEYYVFKCKIINLQNNNESKNMIIIINQSEELDFTMSFSFEQ